MQRQFALLMFLLLLSPGSPSAVSAEDSPPPPPPVAEIMSGQIRGSRDGTVDAYLGIPYAAPPVGDLRWRPPALPGKWEGVRDCLEFGPSCPQPGRSFRKPGRQSEDCLYLNVWAPAKPAVQPGTTGVNGQHPVLIWIHGGGFTIGSGALPWYAGASLARRGVVVTINYRLGPFGFFGHRLLARESEHKVSGNYGLLDQIAALRWVKRNIAAFGGDPECVTVFGESAGAVSVCTLLVMPEAKGLFHRAIAQSGGAGGIRRRLVEDRDRMSSLHTQGRRLAHELGCQDKEDILAALRQVPAEELLEKAGPEVAGFNPEHKYGPVVDGHYIPDEPYRLLSDGKAHPVPVLAGSNAEDGDVFAKRFSGSKLRRPIYLALLSAAYGPGAKEVALLFPPGNTRVSDDTVLRLFTVSAFVTGARFTVRAMEQTEAPAFLYHFTRSPANLRRLGIGAGHGREIAYVFGADQLVRGFDESDRKLADAMQRYWINFARTGDPNAEGLQNWPKYVTETDQHLELGTPIHLGANLFKKECDLFDRLR